MRLTTPLHTYRQHDTDTTEDAGLAHHPSGRRRSPHLRRRVGSHRLRADGLGELRTRRAYLYAHRPIRRNRQCPHQNPDQDTLSQKFTLNWSTNGTSLLIRSKDGVRRQRLRAVHVASGGSAEHVATGGSLRPTIGVGETDAKSAGSSDEGRFGRNLHLKNPWQPFTPGRRRTGTRQRTNPIPRKMFTLKAKFRGGGGVSKDTRSSRLPNVESKELGTAAAQSAEAAQCSRDLMISPPPTHILPNYGIPSAMMRSVSRLPRSQPAACATCGGHAALVTPHSRQLRRECVRLAARGVTSLVDPG